MRRRIEDEESENINDKYGGGKFQKVPIGDSQSNSIEVYNVYSGLDLSKVKCRKKVYNAILIVIVIGIFIMLSRILKLTQLINEDPDPILNNDNIREDFDEDDEEYKKYNNDDIKSEFFYILQKKEKIDLNNFSSPQLRKPENIKVIEKLEVSLDLEYEKFVHLRIKDPHNERWEVPDQDVLDKDYILNRNENKVPITKYSDEYEPHYDSQFFYVEFLYNETYDNEKY